MEEKKYELKLNGLVIDNIVFKINSSFVWPKEPINVNPSFERMITKLNEDSAMVSLIVDVDQSEKLPFSLHVQINGSFELEKWEEDDISQTLIKDNAAAILFPYLRHAVSEITTISGLPPYIMPVQNVSALFANNEKQQ